MLSLEDYRGAVAVDVPFLRPAAVTPEALPSVMTEVITHLEGDGSGAALRAELRGAAPVEPGERLRALLTVRPPAPLPSDFEKKLDAVLSALREERPVTAAGALPRLRAAESPGDTALALWRGDITTLAADAIVNAANSELLGCFRAFHRCIDNAIHAAAGPRLRADCARIMQLQAASEPVGAAKVTRAYHLPSRFVLHTVGPIVQGGVTIDHEAALESCYRSCLDLAARLPGVRSVALCAISTGVFGFPREPAAAIAVASVARWLTEHPGVLDLVIFNAFAAEDVVAYRSALLKAGMAP